jgi:glutamate dehydrogenase
MNPYFFVSMKDEPEALAMLEREMGALQQNRRIILADREKILIQAIANFPGSLYETLMAIRESQISYAMFSHSEEALPGMDRTLEIQRFEFDRKSNEEVCRPEAVAIPEEIRRKVLKELKSLYPSFVMKDFDRLLAIIWRNNQNYILNSAPGRVAQVIQLFQQCNRNCGLHLDVEPGVDGKESRVHFAVANPPQKQFFSQIMEVFNRLDLGINRAYCLTISNGYHPYFLGTFFVRRRDSGVLKRESELFIRLQQELYNSQILSTKSYTYREFVTTGVMTGEDASLVNAFIAFTHSNLAHNQPDRFGLEDVQSAFHAHPEIALQLVKLFRARFDPQIVNREALYNGILNETAKSVEDYNTGHRYLDEIRRAIFRCAFTFICHTLKTNFYVPEKQALAFRLDPAYLLELGSASTSDLPPAKPFRVTFFFSRCGFGYHIGFSDIARGGWRTVIARNPDDFITSSNNLFRENFVLAHTQHLKNKDIYEGGSKMVLVLDAADLMRGRERELEIWRLFKLQYGVINAFLDIFVTEGGVVKSPLIVDYYREEEPIELGPDENMHDSMVEAIAMLSKKRGYMLGIGVISSKEVGINHKEFGVTSTGVVKFAEITMKEIGIDINRDQFSVKFTGGTNGDVAGNAIRIMLERCPNASIRLILDGTAALFDPDGADPAELRRILLQQDVDGFNPDRLNNNGFMLFRTNSRKEGVKELFRKVTKSGDRLQEDWLSIDDFSRQFGELPFTVQADLFIPAGGRPETIDSTNCKSFMLADGTPSSKVIIEGANSFITPEARLELQRRGVIIMRDSSANKCGVISSSYEIIANLLLSETEFLAHKTRYVADVLEILEKRAEEEAKTILKRRREEAGALCTEISFSLSSEINSLYAKLFSFFQNHPELCLQPPFRRAILNHLPKILREEPMYRRRISRLPKKYIYAILAAEIASSMVYNLDRETAFEDSIRLHLARTADQEQREI